MPTPGKKLFDGPYVLRADPNPPGTPACDFVASGGGAVGRTTFGDFAWVPELGAYVDEVTNTTIRFLFDPPDRFAAVVGLPPAARAYVGGYAPKA